MTISVNFTHILQKINSKIYSNVLNPIGTVHDCRSANVVGIKNVNTVLLNVENPDFQELVIN